MSLGVHLISKAPLPGFCKTRIGHEIGYERAADLQEAFLFDHLKLLNTLEIAFHLWLADPNAEFQHASLELSNHQLTRLGSKNLHEVLSEAWEYGNETLGWDYQIFIGTDSILALEKHLSSAIELGQKQIPSLGPAEDGGIYLMGLPSKETIHFEDIPWESSEVYEALRSQFPDQSRILPMEKDIDYLKDLLWLQDHADALPSSSKTKALLHSLRLQS